MMNLIRDVNVFVVVGSVDGMAAAAACMRCTANPDIYLVFTETHKVGTIDVSKWSLNSKVGLIDLAVNNENPQLTIDFVNKIYQCGHKILFIADEHGKKAWKNVLGICGYSMKELIIRPKDRGNRFQSSSAILKKAFGDFVDDYTKELLDAGNQADQMNFNTYFGKIFNNSIKSNMRDPERRPYLVKHLAFHKFPDEKITGWMNECAEINS